MGHPSDPQPPPLFDVQLLTAGMDEVELALWIRAVETAIAVHGVAAVLTSLDDSDAVQVAPPVERCVRFERFYN